VTLFEPGGQCLQSALILRVLRPPRQPIHHSDILIALRFHVFAVLYPSQQQLGVIGNLV
jgi:hypothetical protein